MIAKATAKAAGNFSMISLMIQNMFMHMGTVQSLYNIPHFNMDWHITRSHK